jgi:hypothetical protein
MRVIYTLKGAMKMSGCSLSVEKYGISNQAILSKLTQVILFSLKQILQQVNYSTAKLA